MRKQVSTPFAIVVILIAIALGALYFLVQNRAWNAEWDREAAMLKRQADMAQRSGRRGQMGRMGAKAGARMRQGGAPGSSAKGKTAGPKPGSAGPAAKAGKAPTAKPEQAGPKTTAPTKPTKTEKK